jgi:hypothetical protein
MKVGILLERTFLQRNKVLQGTAASARYGKSGGLKPRPHKQSRRH